MLPVSVLAFHLTLLKAALDIAGLLKVDVRLHHIASNNSLGRQVRRCRLSELEADNGSLTFTAVPHSLSSCETGPAGLDLVCPPFHLRVTVLASYKWIPMYRIQLYGGQFHGGVSMIEVLRQRLGQVQMFLRTGIAVGPHLQCRFCLKSSFPPYKVHARPPYQPAT
jgi:hypothetical protein